MKTQRTTNSPIIEPPIRSPKRTAFKPVRSEPFPPISNLASLSNPYFPSDAKARNTNTTPDEEKPIYPSEILSPPTTGTPEQNPIENPLKTVRFAHTYHTNLPTIPASDIPAFSTADAHIRTKSNTKRERKNSQKGKFMPRPISDPALPEIASERSLPLRGTTPVKQMPSRSTSGKRVERERSQSSRTCTEYGPHNLPKPIRPAARDLETIARIESSLILQSFSCADAWALGSALRDRLIQFDKPTVINITLASGQVLFHCCTRSGTTIDNTAWVERKRNSVLRWGVSTWYLSQKFGGDYNLFAIKNGLGPADVAKYAIHGGGMPIRVQGVEGAVAVVVVSGLKQDEDHEVIVETIQEHWY